MTASEVRDEAERIRRLALSIRDRLHRLESSATGMDAWSLRGAEVHAEHASDALHSVWSVLDAMLARPARPAPVRAPGDAS